MKMKVQRAIRSLTFHAQAAQLIRHSLVAIFLSLTFTTVNAQTNYFQDAKGETSILTPSSVIMINTSDASISGSYGKRVSTNNYFWGLSLKLKAEEGIVKVISNGDINLYGKGGFFLVWQDKKKIAEGRLTNYYIAPAYQVSAIKLYDTAQSFDNRIVTKNFKSALCKIGFNRISSTGFMAKDESDHSAIKWGLSIEFGNTNNLNELTALEITDIQIVANADSSKVKSIQSGKKNAFGPAVKYQDKLGYVTFSGDYIIFPGIFNRRVGVDLFWRANCIDTYKPRHNPGIGVFLSKKGAPEEVVLGLVYQMNDAFNVVDAKKTTFERSTVTLTAGFTLQ